MGGKGYRPMNKSELSRELSLSTDDRSMLRSELAAMTKEGVIEEGKKGRYEAAKSKNADHLRGVVRFLPRGHAWFYPDAADEENQNSGIDLKKYSRVHIPRRDTGTALEGDRVEIQFQLPRSGATARNSRRKKSRTPAARW